MSQGKNTLLKGPKTPYLFKVFQLAQNPIGTLETWGAKYGDIFQLGNKTQPIISISKPHIIQQVFSASSEQIGYTQTSNIVKILLGTDALILLPEVEHQHQKKQVLPYFNHDHLHKWGAKIQEISKEVMNKQIAENQIFKVRPVMKEISLKVLLIIIFGEKPQKERKRLTSLFTQLFNLFDNSQFLAYLLLPLLQKNWGLWAKFIKLQEEINQLIDNLIEQARSNKQEVNNFLLESLVTNNSLNNTQITSLIKTIIFAGFETTAVAFCWSLYWLNFLPEVKHKLLLEIDKFHDSSTETILKLPYLNIVCNEILRITPPAIATFSRYVKKDISIDGYTLKPGTEVIIYPYLVHHNKSIYHDPDKFKPERFLEKQFSPYEFIPFGGGQCRCLGASLAQFEMRIVLFSLMKHFSFDLIEKKPIKPTRHGPVLTTPKNFSMKVELKPIS